MGVLTKYRALTDLQLWREYARLKEEFARQNPAATEQQYDEFIRKIVDQLGI